PGTLLIATVRPATPSRRSVRRCGSTPTVRSRTASRTPLTPGRSTSGARPPARPPRSPSRPAAAPRCAGSVRCVTPPLRRAVPHLARAEQVQTERPPVIAQLALDQCVQLPEHALDHGRVVPRVIGMPEVLQLPGIFGQVVE